MGRFGTGLLSRLGTLAGYGPGGKAAIYDYSHGGRIKLLRIRVSATLTGDGPTRVPALLGLPKVNRLTFSVIERIIHCPNWRYQGKGRYVAKELLWRYCGEYEPTGVPDSSRVFRQEPGLPVPTGQ